MSILIEDVSKSFGKFIALNHVNLEIETGTLVALVGPSGSGKSTLLKTIAGLEKPDQGRVWLYGKNASLISIQKREIGLVFQNYALFHKMNVYQNIAFGLHVRKKSPSVVKERVDQLLETIQLEKLAYRFPSQLSGGQKQRVALARALSFEPKILLLDEPFGALDRRIRKGLRDWLRKLHDQSIITTVLVTHNYQEAVELADEIVVFTKGHVKEILEPKSLLIKSKV